MGASLLSSYAGTGLRLMLLGFRDTPYPGWLERDAGLGCSNNADEDCAWWGVALACDDVECDDVDPVVPEVKE